MMDRDHTPQHTDPVALFQRAEELFGDSLDILQLVASSPIRALFVAWDRVLKRRVALRAHLEPGTRLRTWFERETELMAALDHPVLRPVYSAGHRREWAYRIVKWIEGESLAAAVARGPRPIPAVLQLSRNVTNALEYAHSRRIVIRRIVPATVMIETTERTYVTDLRYCNACLDVAPPDEDTSASPYLAPEVRDGSAGEPWSDVYGAGALLYFATTGTPPAADPASIVPPRELRDACPQALQRVIMRALSPEPTDRYLTAGEMGEDLVSDLGEYQAPVAFAPELASTSQDSQVWEKRLRRALGDEYELLEELGSGGFGRVYRVRDLALEREVALKVLHPHLTADSAVVDRFRREARVAAQVMHPHIANTYDIGGRAGLLWYTMEYVRGKNLARLVETEGPQPVQRVLRLLEEALTALKHAHERGLVHRDLKPENLLIEDATGSLRIADFGLAVALQPTEGIGGVISHSGTPAFAAPEQLLGEAVDGRTDLYSISLAAYFGITGNVPFGGGTVESIIARQAAGQLPLVTTVRSDVPERLLRVLQKGAAHRPDDRFESADAFAGALRDAQHPWQARVRRAFIRLVQRA
ncbi:MAG: protein kinase [Gemmatimonadales bacterium]|nr:protein kinase [Gemmatimonadales bacterium]NIN13337.1 protein kinase [Gemmatimonadales bacterium]NIN51340.1 protein kinase [Gemmatimonadales bacterium]NIP08804.1 protein kinase [Gemmatimonadales bacterium]NIQ99798.1 protein kinase [Gemmatimonadales bacterium]